MHAPSAWTFPFPLSDGLVLRRAAARNDLEQVVLSHKEGFGDNDDPQVLRANLCDRPGSRPEDVVFVEDTATGEVVSSVSLIRQTWSYEGAPIRVGEVGIVSTRPDYRRRGLVREQFRAFHHLARQAGCVMSVIAGIPYFYRQFGYEFILPMGKGVKLTPDRVPGLGEEARSHYAVHSARAEDVHTLLAMYGRLIEGMALTTCLDADIWSYQDGLPDACADRRLTLVVTRDGKPVGYLRTMANEDDGFNKGVVVHESFLPEADAAMAALDHLAKMAREERSDQTTRIFGPDSATLVQTALDFGGSTEPGYAWQICILDHVQLLFSVRATLERRIAASPWAGLTRDVYVGWYVKSAVLRFRSGRIESVCQCEPPTRHDLRCPPNALAMIVLGRRSIEEVLDWFPDAGCRDAATRRLMSTIFPKRESWIMTLF